MKGDVIVVGGGSTLRDYSLKGLHNLGTVIGVNDSAIHCKVHQAITMDRLWYESRAPILTRRGIVLHYRDSIAKNLAPAFNCLPFINNNRTNGLSDQAGVLCGNNSGVVGINLGYQQKPRRLFLLGFDMCRHPTTDQPYWYDPYPWNNKGGTSSGKYRKWSTEFEAMVEPFKAAGIQVYNVTHRSAIEQFPKITFDNFLEMTR